MWYFLLGFFIGLSISAVAFSSTIFKMRMEEKEQEKKPPNKGRDETQYPIMGGKAQFISPVSPEEKLKRAVSIQDILDDIT